MIHAGKYSFICLYTPNKKNRKELIRNGIGSSPDLFIGNHGDQLYKPFIKNRVVTVFSFLYFQQYDNFVLREKYKKEKKRLVVIDS